ncbi:MAG: 30S ribosomal protein S8 [Pseudomonadota bacterium]
MTIVNDPVGDMLTRIRNAIMRSKTKTSTPASKLRGNVLEVLKNEGYIRGYTRTDYEGGKAEFEVELKYHEGDSVIREIARVSKPGRRVYASVKNIPHVSNGLGIAIVSTSKGVMADYEAREQNIGGEVLCTVF